MASVAPAREEPLDHSPPEHMNISMLSGGFPPDFDAIGHYSWQLGTQLIKTGNSISILTSQTRPRTGDTDMEVLGVFNPREQTTLARLSTALRSLASPPEWLIVQYNPFSFGPRGYCPQLITSLQVAKRETGIRIAIMFHETHVPCWPLKFAAMLSWQYPIFSRLCHTADIAFVSTERWLPQVRKANPHLSCHHLPVGANISLCEISKDEARRKLSIDQNALVMGIFGQAHVSRPMDWIASAVHAVRSKHPASQVLYVGPDGALFRSACGGEFIDAGVQPQESLGLYLRAMDFLLSPFADGASTRRGSLMAALQHDVPSATTQRRWTDSILTESHLPGLLLSTAKTASDFGLDVLRWRDSLLGDNSQKTPSLARYYQDHFSWETIAAKLTKELETAN